MLRRVVRWKFTDVSEVFSASIISAIYGLYQFFHASDGIGSPLAIILH
jgi:hypothetical protein